MDFQRAIMFVQFSYAFALVCMIALLSEAADWCFKYFSPFVFSIFICTDNCSLLMIVSLGFYLIFVTVPDFSLAPNFMSQFHGTQFYFCIFLQFFCQRYFSYRFFCLKMFNISLHNLRYRFLVVEKWPLEKLKR